MASDRKRYSHRIQQEVKRTGKTLRQVANEVNKRRRRRKVPGTVTYQTILNWCTGATSPDIDMGRDLAEILGVSLAYLVGEKKKKE